MNTYKNRIRRQQKRLLSLKVLPLPAVDGKTTKKKRRTGVKVKRQTKKTHQRKALKEETNV